jgi:hypothetical protein
MKELIIILYKIDVGGLSRQQVDQQVTYIVKNFSLKEDEELKNNYIIREIFLPVTNISETDVKIIYPIPRYTTSPEINELVAEISNKIKEDPTNALKQQWERLVRELKLRKIENL